MENRMNSRLNDALDGHFNVPEEEDDLTDIAVKEVATGFCIECGDQPASLFCQECSDDYCEVCFAAQHRRGRRAQHKTKPLATAAAAAAAAAAASSSSTGPPSAKVARTDATAPASGASAPSAAAARAAATAAEEKDEEMQSASEDGPADDSGSDSDGMMRPHQQSSIGRQLATPAATTSWFVERSKYIPLRLTLKERKELRLLESALYVSNYTDRVDILRVGSKAKRIHEMLLDICGILSGLLLASNFELGQSVIAGKNFADYASYLQHLFEVGRRHKINNPEKMRSEYGKMVYLLMDSVMPEVQHLLGFSLVEPVCTVHRLLTEKGGSAMLLDPAMAVATAEIHATPDKSRQQVQHEIKSKEGAQEHLARKYSSGELSEDDIRRCLYSIADNHSFLTANRDPCDAMLGYLKSDFSPDTFEPNLSLAIYPGHQGARLSHSHERQYAYVLQSLSLWRDIQQEMFRLWSLSEADLLDESNPYRLRDTGQGLNRVQQAPRISRAMHEILHRCQQSLGGWVGSSVIHLGDTNVPNSLMFIDKYTQVARILSPIVLVLRQIPTLHDSSPGIRQLIDQTYGGPDTLRKMILSDFFRHGFDGSGADNFFDAGSCIDGRLTSAWNWANKIEKKKYFPIFKLAGFVGFDGDFQR